MKIVSFFQLAEKGEISKSIFDAATVCHLNCIIASLFIKDIRKMISQWPLVLQREGREPPAPPVD